MEPLLCDRPLRRVGQRSGDAGRAAAGAPHRDTAAQEPPVGAVLVADPVLVLKVIRLAGEMRLERLLERHDVVGMDAVHPFLGTTDAGGRGQAEHRPPSAREVELLAPEIPLPQPVIRAFRREREPLFASLERVFRARSLRDVMPEQRHATDNGENSDLQNPRTRSGRQRKMRERPGAPIGQGLVDRSREVGLAQGWHRTDERTTQRSFTGTVQDAFEGIVPERDQAIAVDDGHALIQRFDDLATPVLFFEPVHVGAVRAVGEIQRYRGHRQDFPHPVVDHLNESHGEAGPDEVARTAPENAFRPRSIDRLSREERHDDLRRRALDEAIRRSTAAAIGTPCPGQMKWPIVPPSARCARPAACIATMTVAAFTSIRRDGCERCESVSPCVTVPAVATSIVA